MASDSSVPPGVENIYNECNSSLVGFVEKVPWAWTEDSVMDTTDTTDQMYVVECKKSNRGQDLFNGIADSGASNCITNNVCAIYLAEKTGKEIQQWSKPKKIQFGNSAFVESTSFLDGGPLLGNISIVSTAPCTLIGLWNIVTSSCSVVFTEESVDIVFQGEVVYSGGVLRDQHAWYMDAVALIELQLPIRQSIFSASRLPRMSAEVQKIIRHLHRRLNHQASPQQIAQAIRDMVWIDAPTDITANDIIAVFGRYPCPACELGKMRRSPMLQGSGIEPSTVGERVSVDGVPVNVASIDGHVGYFHFRDQFSKYEHSYPYKFKTEFIDAVKDFLQLLFEYGHSIKMLQFDAGSVELSDNTKVQLSNLHIESHPAVPERQNQNTIERSVQTRTYAIATMMLDQVTLSKRFWNWATKAAMDCHNASYISNGKTAFEHMTGRRPNLTRDFKFPFGTPVMVKDHDRDSFRFTPQAVYGVTLCSTTNSNGGIYVYIPSVYTKPVVRFDIRDLKMVLHSVPRLVKQEAMEQVMSDSSQVTIVSGGPDLFEYPKVPRHEDDNSDNGGTVQEKKDLLSHLPSSEQHIIATEETKQLNQDPIASRTRSHEIANQYIFLAKQSLNHEDLVSQKQVTLIAWAQENGMTDEDFVDSFDISSESVESSIAYLAMSEQTEDIVQAQSPEEFQAALLPNRDAFCALATKRRVRTEANPTVTQAMKTTAGKARWDPVIEKEMEQLRKRDVGTPTLHQDIPKGAKIVQSKIDLKAQINPDGSHKKDKARICAMDNLRVLTTFVNTFAATGNEITLKILIQIAVTMRWLIFGVDFVGAFLHSDLPKGMEVYMQLPKYFDKDGRSIYWRLNKAMYGLRESPAIFTEHVRSTLIKAGWKCLISDRAVYMIQNSDGDIGILFTHSDDERLFCSHERVCEQLIATLKGNNFEITLGLNESFVGYKESRLKNGTIHLSMPAKVQALCSDITLDEIKDTPMTTTCKEELAVIGQKEVTPEQKTDFRSKIGTALFLTKVMPEIQPATQILAQQVNNLNITAVRAARHLRMYIKGRQNRGIAFTPGSDIIPVFESDAAFDVFSDSRSNGAYSCKIGSHDTAAVIAKTFVLPNIPTSSCEAEIVAGAGALKTIIYVRFFLEEITFKQNEPTVCFIDNLSMLTMCSEYAGNLKRVKHILRLLNFMVHHTQQGIVKWVHKPTKELTVDLLTKIHGPQSFIHFTNILLGPDVSDQVPASEEI